MGLWLWGPVTDLGLSNLFNLWTFWLSSHHFTTPFIPISVLMFWEYIYQRALTHCKVFIVLMFFTWGLLDSNPYIPLGGDVWRFSRLGAEWLVWFLVPRYFFSAPYQGRQDNSGRNSIVETVGFDCFPFLKMCFKYHRVHSDLVWRVGSKIQKEAFLLWWGCLKALRTWVVRKSFSSEAHLGSCSSLGLILVCDWQSLLGDRQQWGRKGSQIWALESIFINVVITWHFSSQQ